MDTTNDSRNTIEVHRTPSRVLPCSGHAGAPGDGFASRHTFGAFVVGASNQLAEAACRAVAERPSCTYNPLFIYAGCGLGKTHLLRAVGHEVARRHPSLRLLYLSSERFTNELIGAIRQDRTAEFRAKYRTIDVLLVDDIQFVSGKERTQGELAHTFNDLYEGRSQIVVSSDCPPRKIPAIEDQLRSRLEGGLIADIRPPDFETRLCIVKKRAERQGVHLPDDVAELVARRVRSNVREIEGCLTRLIAFCALRRREMTADVAHEALAGLWGPEEHAVVTIEDVQRKVAGSFGVSLADLRGGARGKAVVHARQVAMYLARHLTHATLAEVGHAFGGKDHTTVLHAINKVRALLEQQPTLLDRVGL
jgi:chromosomal replication initiator protein